MKNRKSVSKEISLKNKKKLFDGKSEDIEDYEDPAILKKQGILYLQKKDLSYYRKKIVDENYMDHAINRIAMELMHFILKDR